MEGRATKRYATLAALTLALGGAVFLNWSFAGRTPQLIWFVDELCFADFGGS